jgi:hypothetical protein
MLGTRWDATTWPTVKAEIRKALQGWSIYIRSRIWANQAQLFTGDGPLFSASHTALCTARHGVGAPKPSGEWRVGASRLLIDCHGAHGDPLH